MDILKSRRLEHLKYEIRGPVYDKALALQNQGYKITSLNIGNPAAFGFETPDEIVHDIIVNIRNAQGYTDSRGLFAARKAVMQYYQNKGVKNILIEDIYIGNGVSELISLVMMALLNSEDEVLIPSPDYPLWTTVVGLAGGNSVHYVCDESTDWQPDLEDMEAKITDKCRAIVMINPNNPTGAVYSKETVDKIVQLAAKHKLILFSDEIYDKILYDQHDHHSAAGLSDEILIVTMGGLSKNYRAAGFRGGWMILTGAKHKAKSYIEGLNFLFSTRLCANVITQFGIQTALGGYQSINDLVAPGGRLYKQMQLAYEKLNAIDGVSCVKPKGALYLFPKIDLGKFTFEDDEHFVMSLLEEQKILVVAGRGFNFKQRDHFRIVFLPHVEQLSLALDKIALHFDNYRR
ncbi:pyridoxal phosphate-dependent aminotransferase [Aquirufa ecclesiirivi]|uniref:alanine transaminase n=1 Tax=Aquirufa ecclesiirivi TaxID=2715124 RepID=A0ABT4JD18_9BACT|nr:pyridoxal phosphate-dependent aminotransferase [Aquirufa ecclesiirivi]MCZ2472133.1 pyridoxal phosphate-dependent aminotransferase [Aquirufa ecclesiirivi]MCZ2474189.1 pyridoxal phosphate-dependent aminotransferase [Aquirufa ecclesiirivi]MDF0693841.1 pyridoxal phosphate-dependent aminotransferase [Aquirufa ecclesiirivi]NHC48519.1 pyridoxal phosphate-dependent aminotransferase [Aquirufa ecclesiirivi]